MSRRRRAIALGLAAAVCAALAAALAGGYRDDVEAQLGGLRPVVVARRPLPARGLLKPGVVRTSLEVRRVPDRFAPPDALADPAEAAGLVPSAPIPAGSYVVAGQLRATRGHARGPAPRRLEPGRRPVEIAVVGAAALEAGPGGRATEVDVVVTSEPGPGGGAGRTYLAAQGVPLLDLRSTADLGGGDGLGEPGPEPWTATLALTRSQALRLIQAESFARGLRLIQAR
jgi:Flp pilus assembly protein CpaB